MTAKSVKDITRTLEVHFSALKPPVSLPSDIRRIIQSFVAENDGKFSEEESTRTNQELKAFWGKYVGDSPQKLAVFVGVLRELRFVITGEANVLRWWQLVMRPVIDGAGYSKPAVEDAREFLLGVLVPDDANKNDHDGAKVSNKVVKDLLEIYITRTRAILGDGVDGVAQQNSVIVQQVEDVLVAFGQKRPKDLFHSLDDLVVQASTRLQALTLLSSFLQHQTPHLYLVINTPLVEHLLKCLMNDTSTTVLSVALSSLTMLLPHIPGSLAPQLPRMFLLYSRLLCWEKFSPLSTEADKNLVTDDRLPHADPDDISISSDVGIDLNWVKVQPQEGLIEASTPELLTYFTYLYGLYPLNFMSYIRKSRRYLKDLEFPGAEAFDLDQAVIRSRTEQFRQVHLLHPNFFNMTVEEELADPKWPKMDPADVVGECHGLCINPRPLTTSQYIAARNKPPDLSPMSNLKPSVAKISGQLSPAASHASLRSISSWRDTQSTAVSVATADGGSPRLRPYDAIPDQLRTPSKTTDTAVRTPENTEGPIHPAEITSLRSTGTNAHQVQTNAAYLQREVTLLRNDLNFERWHKAQYSEHISQIMRRNVKAATQEAETLNLINANRALKKQVEQVRKAREATIKDSVLTRKQASTLEASMTERFAKFRKDQEIWQADTDELQRLRSETTQYRDLLVATEARELNKSHKLELAQRDLEKLQKVEAQLQQAQRKLHDHEYREFDFETATRLRDILQKEIDQLKIRLTQTEDDRQRLKYAYTNKIAGLKAKLPPEHLEDDYEDFSKYELVPRAISDSEPSSYRSQVSMSELRASRPIDRGTMLKQTGIKIEAPTRGNTNTIATLSKLEASEIPSQSTSSANDDTLSTSSNQSGSNGQTKERAQINILGRVHGRADAGRETKLIRRNTANIVRTSRGLER